LPLGEVDYFFDTKDLASEAVFVSAPGASPRNILVIFNNEFIPSQVGDARYSNSRPTALCRREDVETATTESTLKVTDITYNVLSVQTDSHGFTVLELTRD